MDSFDPSTSGGESATHDPNADGHSAAMELRHQSSTGSSSHCGDLEQAMSHTRPKPTKGKRKAAKRQRSHKHSTGAKKRGRPRTAPPAEVSPPPHSAAHALHANDGHEACIDEVIDESDALLRAAYEAQSLGRLAAAQSYLYLAHARLVGLGRWLERPHAAEADNGNAQHCGGAAHENLSDQLARSAQHLLQKHGGRGLQHGKRKSTASYTRKKKRKDADGSDDQQNESAAPAEKAPVRSVRTVVHGDRLDAKTMVNEGIHESADEKGSVSLGMEDEGNTTMESEVEEELAVEELDEATLDLPDGLAGI